MTKAFTYANRTVYQSTYRYLRWVMVAALVSLFLSVLIQSVIAGCWLGSVSAYYYTPARTVFVGSLIAFGAALIAYQGKAPEEDVALNFAGFMAIVVAMVPTTEDNLCATSGFGQTKDEVARAVVNNVWSLVGTTAIALLVLLVRWRMRDRHRVDPDASDARRNSRIRTRILAGVCILILVAELWYFLVNPDFFMERSHGIAAITMVGGLVLVMIFNASLIEHAASGYRVGYWLLAGILLLLTVGVLLAKNEHWILVLELVVFAVFVAYWIMQSVELWTDGADSGNPSHPAGMPVVPDGGDHDRFVVGMATTDAPQGS